MSKELEERLRRIEGIHTAEIFKEHEQASPDRFTIFTDLNELHDVLSRIEEEFDDDEIAIVEDDVAVSFFFSDRE